MIAEGFNAWARARATAGTWRKWQVAFLTLDGVLLGFILALDGPIVSLVMLMVTILCLEWSLVRFIERAHENGQR